LSEFRLTLELTDVTEVTADSPFTVFSGAVADGGAVIAMRVPGGAELSRAKMDRLTEEIKKQGGRGLFWLKILDDGKYKSPALKFIEESGANTLAKFCGMENGDALLAVADNRDTAQRTMGELRLLVGRMLGLVSEQERHFLWVTDFPLLEYDEAEKRHLAIHHPFTAPVARDLDRLETSPLDVCSQAYDLVINGLEVGGGSIRIHRPDIQQRVFKLLGIGPAEAKDKFGFLLEALRFGAPPHGGIALGLDRLVMALAGEESIREVIPFPKTTSGSCPLTGAPSAADSWQLDELGLSLFADEEE